MSSSFLITFRDFPLKFSGCSTASPKPMLSRSFRWGVRLILHTAPWEEGEGLRFRVHRHLRTEGLNPNIVSEVSVSEKRKSNWLTVCWNCSQVLSISFEDTRYRDTSASNQVLTEACTHMRPVSYSGNVNPGIVDPPSVQLANFSERWIQSKCAREICSYKVRRSRR